MLDFGETTRLRVLLPKRDLLRARSGELLVALWPRQGRPKFVRAPLRLR
jgi:hypothetical protein